MNKRFWLIFAKNVLRDAFEMIWSGFLVVMIVYGILCICRWLLYGIGWLITRIDILHDIFITEDPRSPVYVGLLFIFIGCIIGGFLYFVFDVVRRTCEWVKGRVIETRYEIDRKEVM